MPKIIISRQFLFTPTPAVRWTKGIRSEAQGEMLQDSPTIRNADVWLGGERVNSLVNKAIYGSGPFALLVGVRHDVAHDTLEVYPAWAGAEIFNEETGDIVRYLDASEIEFKNA